MREVNSEYIERTFRNNYESMIRYAVSMSKDTDIAQDLVSRVFFKVISQPPILQEGKSLRNYMICAISKVFLDDYVKSHYHKKKAPIDQMSTEKVEELLETRVEPYDPFEDYENLETRDFRKNILRDIVNNMPEKIKEAFTERIINGLTDKEAANKLGINEGALKMNNHRAYKFLRGELAKKGIMWTGKVEKIAGESNYCKGKRRIKRKH